MKGTAQEPTPARGRRRAVVLAAVGTAVVLVAALVVVLVTHRGGGTGPAPEVMTVELGGDALSMSSRLGPSTLRIEATLHNTATNGAFNLVRTLLDGTVVHRTSDDVTPIRTSLGTVGGNHGFSHVAAFSNPDAKTTADLGSVWTDGSRRYELLAIDDTGKLVLGGDYTVRDGVVDSAAVEPVRDLTPVSGAVHRGAIPRAGSATQLRPSTGAVQVAATCDGATIGAAQQECREVAVHESYEVLDYADLYDQAREHVGSSYSTLAVRGAVRIQNDYTFRAGGGMRLHSEVVALQPTGLGETGLLQAAPLSPGPDRTVVRQVPGVQPIQGVDFRAGVDLGSYSSNLRVAAGDLVEPGRPPTFSLDRTRVGGRTVVGFALGYVPTGAQAGSQAARSEAAGADLWDLRGTGKSYPVAVTSRLLAPGDRLVVDGFRTYLAPAQADQVAADVAAGGTGTCPVPALC